MFFIVSKIFGFFSRPSSLVLLGVVVCLVAGHKNRLLRRLSFFMTLVVMALLVLPVGDWAAYPFEKKTAVYLKDVPKQADGIVVLAGGIDPFLTAQYTIPAFNDAGDRAALVPALMRRFPRARVVYTGGSGFVLHQDQREADAAAQFFRDAGLDMGRIVLERDSRNTHENAVFSKKIVKPKNSETWVLVTSALHMPRSVAIFKKIGWNVTPYPVDFRAQSNPPLLCFCVADNIMILDSLVHEVVGTTVYFVTGRL
jgi:uncharacterized SAM-binding protein YcdF (DUF218 family)